MIHCGGGGGLCRVTLMKLIVFVEFCLIPNCFLPTIEVGGQVCSQNNFLPQERQHTRKGNRAVDAFLEFVKTSPGCIGLSTRSLAVTWIKRCQIDVKVVPRKALGQFISCSTARQWKNGSFTYFSSQLFLFFRWKEQFEFFFVEKCPKFKKHFHICSQCLILWHFGANKKAPFVQLGTFFSQPLPLLLLFLFQFLSWKSADLEFWIRFGHI